MTPHLRAARLEDHEAYARLHHELGISDPPASREIWAADLVSRTVVAELAGEVVAYGLWSVYGTTAHLMNLVVAPTHRGQRLGELVMRDIAGRLRAEGVTDWRLHVKDDNTPAIRLYERMGLRVVSRSFALNVPWSVVDQLPPAEIEVQPLDPANDAAIEAQFDILAGTLEHRRTGARPYFIYAPRDASGAHLGVAAFAPSVPGAHPFRVTRVELAGPLLRALKQHRHPEHDTLNVFVEHNEPLAHALQEAGASLRFVPLQMKGALP